MTLLLRLSTLKCSLVQQPVIKYLHSCGLVWPSLYIHYASMTFSVYNLSPSPDFRLFLFFASLRPEGLPRWHAGRESACKCEKPGFDPLVGKIPWRREWHPTPGFLPGKSRGQRSLVGYSRWSCRIRYDEQLSDTCLHPSGHGEICNINVHKVSMSKLVFTKKVLDNSNKIELELAVKKLREMVDLHVSYFC